jgi:hypothetical protein
MMYPPCLHVPLVCAAFAVVGDAAGAGHMGYGLTMMTSRSISLSDLLAGALVSKEVSHLQT